MAEPARLIYIRAMSSAGSHDTLPSTLLRPRAAVFWLAVLLTGAGVGISAIVLTSILEAMQRLMWGGTGTDLLGAATTAPATQHVLVLLGAGVTTGVGQIMLRRLASGNV